MNDLARKSSPIDRARLDAVIEPVVRAHGGEVADLEWKHEAGGWVLRIFVEKAGSSASNASTLDAGVSLELCSGVARDLSPALDVADIIPHRYHLEVSSPGVERPLKKPADYARFAGKKAIVWVKKPDGGKRSVVGLIEPCEDASSVCLREGERLHTVPLDSVVSAHLVFEFGPAPKPGKGPRKGASPRREGAPKPTGDAGGNDDLGRTSRVARGDSDSR